MNIIHSASIKGLKWVSYFGNLVIMVTKDGILKLIAVNFDYKD